MSGGRGNQDTLRGGLRSGTWSGLELPLWTENVLMGVHGKCMGVQYMYTVVKNTISAHVATYYSKSKLCQITCDLKLTFIAFSIINFIIHFCVDSKISSYEA